MKKVYFISGLGADKRVFSFLDLSFCDPIFIDWINPIKNESLSSYAIRLRKLIPEINPTVVGISFGGMLVTEMSKVDDTIKAIILSSNKTAAELPSYFRVGKYVPLYKWLPNSLFRRTMYFSKWLLGPEGKEQKELMRKIIADTDIQFTKWAMAAIIHWGNKLIPRNIIHIHGTADKLLPYRLIKSDYTIKGGTHLMTMNNAEEISVLLKKLI